MSQDLLQSARIVVDPNASESDRMAAGDLIASVVFTLLGARSKVLMVAEMCQPGSTTIASFASIEHLANISQPTVSHHLRAMREVRINDEPVVYEAYRGIGGNRPVKTLSIKPVAAQQIIDALRIVFGLENQA